MRIIMGLLACQIRQECEKNKTENFHSSRHSQKWDLAVKNPCQNALVDSFLCLQRAFKQNISHANKSFSSGIWVHSYNLNYKKRLKATKSSQKWSKAMERDQRRMKAVKRDQKRSIVIKSDHKQSNTVKNDWKRSKEIENSVSSQN